MIGSSLCSYRRSLVRPKRHNRCHEPDARPAKLPGSGLPSQQQHDLFRGGPLKRHQPCERGRHGATGGGRFRSEETARPGGGLGGQEPLLDGQRHRPDRGGRRTSDASAKEGLEIVWPERVVEWQALSVMGTGGFLKLPRWMDCHNYIAGLAV